MLFLIEVFQAEGLDCTQKWVEEDVEGKYEEIIEYNPANNYKSILNPNPMETNNGNQFLVTIEQENNATNSNARVKAKNLAK